MTRQRQIRKSTIFGKKEIISPMIDWFKDSTDIETRPSREIRVDTWLIIIELCPIRNEIDSIRGNQNRCTQRLSVSFSKVGRGYCDKGQTSLGNNGMEKGAFYSTDGRINYELSNEPNVQRCLELIREVISRAFAFR